MTRAARQRAVTLGEAARHARSWTNPIVRRRPDRAGEDECFVANAIAWREAEGRRKRSCESATLATGAVTL